MARIKAIAWYLWTAIAVFGAARITWELIAFAWSGRPVGALGACAAAACTLLAALGWLGDILERAAAGRKPIDEALRGGE